MSREFSPVNTSFPVSIPISNPQSNWIAPYADFARPADDHFTLRVELSTDEPTPTKVLVELLQNQGAINRGVVTLGWEQFTITNTPTEYTVRVDGSKAVMGRCNLSELYVRVTPPIAVACCFVKLPPVLTITSKLVKADGVTVYCQNSTQIFWDDTQQSWVGVESDLCGCTVEYRLTCNQQYHPATWTLYRNISCPLVSYPGWAVSPLVDPVCDPFELIFASSCYQCCGDPTTACGLYSVVTP